MEDVETCFNPPPRYWVPMYIPHLLNASRRVSPSWHRWVPVLPAKMCAAKWGNVPRIHSMSALRCKFPSNRFRFISGGLQLVKCSGRRNFDCRPKYWALRGVTERWKGPYCSHSESMSFPFIPNCGGSRWVFVLVASLFQSHQQFLCKIHFGVKQQNRLYAANWNKNPWMKLVWPPWRAARSLSDFQRKTTVRTWEPSQDLTPP